MFVVWVYILKRNGKKFNNVVNQQRSLFPFKCLEIQQVGAPTKIIISFGVVA
jgi:hypothetical protein|tara:strand:- start:400 stop:555 length:156 start_codon:yes stop_codon:yes gene_type:complete